MIKHDRKKIEEEFQRRKAIILQKPQGWFYIPMLSLMTIVGLITYILTQNS